MYTRKKSNLLDAGQPGTPKRIILDVVFVLMGPLIIIPYTQIFGVIWTVLAVIFLVTDVVQFVRNKRNEKGAQQVPDTTRADETEGDVEK